MTKPRRRHSRQFKQDAVNLVTEQGYSIAQAARNLGINANMLGRWKHELASDPEAFRGNGKLTAEQEEIRRLKRELAKARMERDILKKATAFFANESK